MHFHFPCSRKRVTTPPSRGAGSTKTPPSSTLVDLLLTSALLRRPQLQAATDADATPREGASRAMPPAVVAPTLGFPLFLVNTGGRRFGDLSSAWP
jgi:hypothetical protein